MKKSHGLVGLVLAAFVAVPLAVVGQETLVQAQESGTVEAKTDVYRIDSVHSSNVFRIKHLNVAYFYGRFNDLSGQFALNAAEPSQNRIEVTVKTASVDTNHEGRDRHLRSPDYFDADKYPEITFKSTGFKKTGEQTFDVTGELALHGVTKTITVPLEITGTGPGMRGEYRAGWETTFTIKRSEYGMTTMLEGLSDEVRLTVAVEGVRQ